jgi:hypothetical protein
MPYPLTSWFDSAHHRLRAGGINLAKIVAPLQGANTFLLHILPQGVALGCGLAPLQGAQTTLKGSNSKARGGPRDSLLAVIGDVLDNLLVEKDSVAFQRSLNRNPARNRNLLKIDYEHDYD